jgi:hypothetical protein
MFLCCPGTTNTLYPDPLPRSKGGSIRALCTLGPTRVTLCLLRIFRLQLAISFNTRVAAVLQTSNRRFSPLVNVFYVVLWSLVLQTLLRTCLD